MIDKPQDLPKLLIIIPAYNEALNIPHLADDLKAVIDSVVLINDGSTDDTSEVALRHGFNVIDLPFNLGVSSAVQTGFKYALRNGYKIAVQFDADCQHRADQIPQIIKPVLEGSADIVVGSRILAGGYKFGFLRNLGRRWFCLLLRVFAKTRLTDPTSGFRCYSREAIEFFIRHFPDGYPEVESIVYASKVGLRITEAPALMRQRTAGKSSIGILGSIYYMVKVTLAVLISSLRNVRG